MTGMLTATNDRKAALRAAAKGLAALRKGTATHACWIQLRECLTLALAIEGHGRPLGISGHLAAALQALQAIHARSEECQPDSDRPYDPCLDELDCLQNALELHELQLSRMTTGTLALAKDTLTNRAMGQLTSACARPYGGISV